MVNSLRAAALALTLASVLSVAKYYSERREPVKPDAFYGYVGTGALALATGVMITDYRCRRRDRNIYQ